MLNAEEIVAAARALTGLSETGEPDVREALAVLVDSLNRDADLRPDGAEALRAALTGRFATRLAVNDLLTRHPEIHDERIRGPIVIVGLPRTGTTKLHRMLARHPDLQWLPLWRVLSPVPLGPSCPDGGDPRIALAEQVSGQMRDRFPDFFAAHPMLPLEPEEEIWMQDLVLRGLLPCYTTPVPSYRVWAEKQDVRPWYEYLRTMLRMFQWEDGSQSKSWLLKAPDHLGHLDLLFEMFPDATVVHTHRDPVVAIASLAALSVATRRMYTDQPNPHDAGNLALDHRSGNLRSYLDQRPRFEKHRFVDASYREIVEDPMVVIERACAAAGLDLDDESRARMRAWESDNPPGKHGEHRYSLEAVGLGTEQVAAAFAGYRTAFGRYL